MAAAGRGPSEDPMEKAQRELREAEARRARARRKVGALKRQRAREERKREEERCFEAGKAIRDSFGGWADPKLISWLWPLLKTEKAQAAFREFREPRAE